MRGRDLPRHKAKGSDALKNQLSSKQTFVHLVTREYGKGNVGMFDFF
jgi:hypothetical protein